MTLPLSPAMPARARRALIRFALMSTLSDQSHAFRRHLLEEDDEQLDPILHLTARAVLDGLQMACWRGRTAPSVDMPVFRYCGRTWAANGRDTALVSTIVDDTAGEFRDGLLLPRAEELVPFYGRRAMDAVSTSLCSVIDRFASEASQVFAAGITDARAEVATERAPRQISEVSPGTGGAGGSTLDESTCLALPQQPGSPPAGYLTLSQLIASGGAPKEDDAFDAAFKPINAQVTE